MTISPCPEDRARALARYRKGRAAHVRRISAHVVEVKMRCGCVVEVDFNDPILTSALEKSLRGKGKPKRKKKLH